VLTVVVFYAASSVSLYYYRLTKVIYIAMTQQEAISRTVDRFTNLMDGKVLPYVTVHYILSYYISLIENTETYPKSHSGIVDNFKEEYYRDLDDELDTL
jgi:hypothetical protein